MKSVFIVERRDAKGIYKIIIAKDLKTAYKLALFHGKIAYPSMSYKTMARRFAVFESVFFYDKIRFESETVALYSPLGEIMILTRVSFYIKLV